MPSFIPIKPIRELIPWLNKPLHEIPAPFVQEVKQKLLKFKVDQPKISVVFIAYNEEDFMFCAMASIADSLLEWPTELIVVNNNSTDGTQEILDTLGVQSVMERKQGWSAARNAGLQAAKGEIIITADSDNMYPPQWVSHLSTPLLQHKEVVCVCSLYCFYTLNNKYPPSLNLYQQAKYINILMRHAKRPHLNCMGGSMAFRKHQAIQVGGYTHGGRGEDGHLAFALAEMGQIKLDASREAFSYSSLRTVFNDGSLTRVFFKRLIKHTGRIFKYFIPQKK